MQNALSLSVPFRKTGFVGVIYEEENPYGTLVATVESDGRATYLYLMSTKDESFTPRAVWVRNHIEGPKDSDKESMQKGLAPVFKQECCAHPLGLPEIDLEQLDLVWFEEGNGITLYIEGEVAAIIPPWSGREGVFGYAKEALAFDVGTLPLPKKESLFFDRLKEHLQFWTQRTEASYWPNQRDKILAAYDSVFGKRTNYYAMTSRAFPPIGIAEYERDEGIVYATVGMSLQSMPNVELYHQDVPYHSKIEIVSVRDEKSEAFASLLARIAVFPWLSTNYLDHGHLYESGLDADASNFIFLSDWEILPEGLSELLKSLPTENKVLFAFPIRQEDLLVARARGADFLLRKLKQ